MTEFTSNGDGFVAFAGNAPGRIKAIELAGNEFIAQKDAFLCAQEGVDLDIAFTKKLGAGLFGGEGIFLTTLKGPGHVILQSMTIENLAAALRPFLPSGTSGRSSSSINIGGLFGDR